MSIEETGGWLVANNVGGHESLLLDPVNARTGTLILAFALDLGAAHTTQSRPRPARR
jgi:hypothetical protein